MSDEANIIRVAEDGFPIFPDVGHAMALVRQLRGLDDETLAFLAAQGLHVVSAAEKAVLEATIDSMREATDSDLRGLHEDDLHGLYRAELARRAATEKGVTEHG